jgi:formate hydrogenlyase transcriptional activator
MQNVIERAVILSQSSVLELNPGLIPLPEPSRSVRDSGNQEVAPAPAHLAGTLEEMERAHIVSVLSQTRGVVEGPSGAAKILGLHPNTLRHRMQKLGIKRAAHRES